MKAGTYDDESPEYHVRRYRAMKEEEAEAIDAFLQWLEWDADTDAEEFTIRQLKAFANAYLGRDMAAISVGERRMLEAWIKAAKEVREAQ